MSNVPLCYFCNELPSFRNENGSYSAYCCKSHMLRDVKEHPEDACQYCGQKPQYIENGTTYPYCGKTQLLEGRDLSSIEQIERDVSYAVEVLGWVSQGVSPSTAPGLAGGKKPPSVSIAPPFSRLDSDRVSVERGISNPCLYCMANPQQPGSDFCSMECGSNAYDDAPLVLPSLPRSSTDYRSVSQQFEQTWRHTNKAIPRIVAISKIITERQSLKVYRNYRGRTEGQGHFQQRGMTEGNECRRFHGTVRACTLGDPGARLICCDDPRCNLCGIISTSFNYAISGSRTNFGRFGRGIYTTSTSSKADDYSLSLQSPYKTLLLNNVVVGSAVKLTETNENLSAPPRGYHSVMGEPGDDLNYDELVVYNNDAIRPAYLILYEVPAATEKV